ncbi:MAG: oligosaccharide flippase family protein [Eubacterium sp.]|nr:oligosaccharide flippase family protein [Eubacterium sp.]
MKKFKLFIENFLVYGLGGIITKLIPLIMVPIVTAIMPNTSYFGISDLTDTIIAFGTALAIMGMVDAMYRMFFEKEETEYRKVVCSTTLTFTLISSVVLFLLMILFRVPISALFLKDEKYSYIVCLAAVTTLISSTNSVIAAPTRMQNKRKVFLITNAIGPLLSYGLAIPLLLAGYYLIALPLAGIVSAATMEVTFYLLNREWFRLKLFDKNMLKQLLVIALPLLPNFLIYWVFNSCDKVMIANILDTGATGVYAVGSKLGHASQLIYLAYAGGWQYFAFSTMKEDNQVESNSKIFEYLGVISFAVTAFVCAGSHLIFELLFAERYLSGYIVAPYLFLAPLLQMLFQVAANQFLVVKRTWPNLLILSAGAALNFVINMFLIPVLGIEGAALATLAGSVVSDIVCVLVLIRMKLMVVSGKFVLCTLLMAAFMVAWRFVFPDRVLIGTGVALIVCVLFVVIYREDLKAFLRMIRGRKKTAGDDADGDPAETEEKPDEDLTEE